MVTSADLCLFPVSRLEEKEAEMKKEYTKLHERYTEVSSCLPCLIVCLLSN